jgi:flagellar biosynthesis protein FlhG
MEEIVTQAHAEVIPQLDQECASGIAIASGKGGVGKTNVVANLAAALSLSGRKVLVLDADFGLSNLDVLLGLCPRYHIGHFLQGEKRLDEIVVEGPAGIRILPAASGLPHLAALRDDHRRRLIRGLNELRESVDLLLVDTSSGISSNVTGFVAACSRAIVVTDPEPTSLVDAYALIKIMQKIKPHAPPELLVNSVATENEAREIYRHVRLATERFLSFAIEFFGFIENDPFVPKAVRHQKLVVLEYPESPAGQSFFRLADSLLTPSTPALPIERGPVEIIPFPQKKREP